MITEQIDPASIQKFKEIIERHTSFVITTHHNSDGDAVGSSTAFAEVLRQMGKEVTIVLPNDYPAFFRWMCGTDAIIDYEHAQTRAKEVVKHAEVIICLDFNQLSRIDTFASVIESCGKPIIAIDHHLGFAIDATAYVSVPDASSTCELVYHVIQLCGYGQYVNRDVAESLYTGLMTDTGRLDYSSSYAEVYAVVGALVEKGIRKTFIHDRIYNVFTPDRFALLGTVLHDNFVYIPEYKAAYMTITLQNKKDYHFQLGDSESFVNYPLMMQDVKFCALFTEYENHTVKVSLRSKRDFPASTFASEYYQGGGHFNAAGGKIHGTLDDAVRLFKEGLPKYQEYLQK